MTRKPDRPGRPGPKRKVLRAVSGDPLKMPRGLTEEARREWRRVARHAAVLGLRGMDQALLSTYCEAWATWLAARRTLVLEGSSYIGPNGTRCKVPEVEIARRAESHMLKAASELGLSPLARSRITVDDPGESEEEREEMDLLFGEGERERRREAARRRGQEDEEEIEIADDPFGDAGGDPPNDTLGLDSDPVAERHTSAPGSGEQIAEDTTGPAVQVAPCCTPPRLGDPVARVP